MKTPARLLSSTFTLVCALAAGCSGGAKPEAAADNAPSVDIEAQLEACARCHKADKLDLSGLGHGELLGKLKAIRDGSLEHPSEMSGLDDAQLEAIARALGAK
jgi:cytochrome c553